MRRIMQRPRRYRDVRILRLRPDRDVGVLRPRRDQDVSATSPRLYRDETFKKNVSRRSVEMFQT